MYGPRPTLPDTSIHIDGNKLTTRSGTALTHALTPQMIEMFTFAIENGNAMALLTLGGLFVKRPELITLAGQNLLLSTPYADTLTEPDAQPTHLTSAHPTRAASWRETTDEIVRAAMRETV